MVVLFQHSCNLRNKRGNFPFKNTTANPLCNAPSTPRRRNLKTQQSPVILDLCLTKLVQGNHVTPSFSDVFVFKTFSVHTNAKLTFPNPSV